LKTLPKPPKAYEQFLKRYPKIEEAWGRIAETGKDGPLDDRTMRLVKLAVAIGALREGAVRAGVRKALAQGIPRAAIEQLSVVFDDRSIGRIVARAQLPGSWI
jgi:4-carboxymuconolactone decarboxylase